MENETEKTDLPNQPALPPAGSTAAAVQPRLWSRRRLVTFALSVSAGFVALFWSGITKKMGSVPEPPVGSERHNPRFRRKKTPALSAAVSLGEGFYARPPTSAASLSSRRRPQKRTIIHYVDAKHRVPFVSRLNEKRLRPASPAELAMKSADARVHLARTSALFEMAALEHIGNHQYGDACQTLIDGINNDLAFKRDAGGGPSLRLFDLLAVVALRQKQTPYFDALLKLAEKAKSVVARQNVGLPAPRKRRGDSSRTPPAATTMISLEEAQKKLEEIRGKLEEARQKRLDAFEARLKKWRDANSKWQERLKNPNQQVAWSVTVAPDTSGGKNVVRKFEIPHA